MLNKCNRYSLCSKYPKAHPKRIWSSTFVTESQSSGFQNVSCWAQGSLAELHMLVCFGARGGSLKLISAFVSNSAPPLCSGWLNSKGFLPWPHGGKAQHAEMIFCCYNDVKKLEESKHKSWHLVYWVYNTTMTDKLWVTQGFKVLSSTSEVCLNSFMLHRRYHKQTFCLAMISE